jgi:3-oxoadipate enol-lactonase
MQEQHPLFATMGDGTRIAYRLDGPEDLPVLVLSNSIGTTMQMWRRQVPQLATRFRVLRYDMRGHGRSAAPAGAYSLARFGRDVLELLDLLGVEKAHFLGLSLGGYVGQWLGVHAPERIDRLVLSNTSPWLGPAPQWNARIDEALRAPDMREIAEGFLANWFPAAMRAAQDPAIDEFRSMLHETDPRGLAGAFAVVRDADLRRTDALITRPTLVIAGRDDTVTLASHGEQIAATIPGARLLVLPTVHLSNVELPERFMQAVLDFLLD